MAALLRRNRKRTGTPADLLVVGLGNPGGEYEGTRHNVGVEVVEALARRHGGRLKKGRHLALEAELRIGEHRVALAFPQTYMNESGQSVRELVRRFGIDDLTHLVIVHDELDLEPGRMKIKSGGGLAGHNGLRSIRDHLRNSDFTRIRIGVGKPSSSAKGRDHVLRRPNKAVRAELDVVVQEAADAVEAMLEVGLDAVMNRYNTTT